MRHRIRQSSRLVAACVIISLVLGAIPVNFAQDLDTSDMPLNTQVSVPGGSSTISVDYADENIRTVLRELSLAGNFNLVMDDSVTGDISVSLSNVTINQALQSVAELGNLEIVPKSGNIFLAISRKAATDKGLTRQLSKVIRLEYANAKRVAGMLNASLFAQANANAGGGGAAGAAGGGGAAGAIQKVRPDNHTNSIIVVGTAHEIQIAENTVRQIDKPRHRKTFYLSHANVLDVASMLAGSVFNDGTATLEVGEDSGGGAAGGGASGGSGGGAGGGVEAAKPTKISVELEEVAEGAGINNLAGSSGGASGSSASGSLSQSITLRGMVKKTDTAKILPEGPIIVPDTRTNAVTIMGTVEQIALAEQMIPILDAQLPQVSIEVALIEISEIGVKEMGSQLGVADGRMQVGFNNVGIPATIEEPAGAPNGLIGLPSRNVAGQGLSGIGFSTSPLVTQSNYLIQLENLITESKAKILANPTVVAGHDTESVISLVNEVIRRTTVTIEGTSGTVTRETEVGDAGIVLDILPKIGEDGTVNMRIRPSVTSVLAEEEDTGGNAVTLLSKRDLLTQNVRIRDNETLVIGGIINESENRTHQKVPLLGDLPIVGALLRSSARSKNRTELVILITPHILNRINTTPVSYTESITPGGDY